MAKPPSEKIIDKETEVLYRRLIKEVMDARMMTFKALYKEINLSNMTVTHLFNENSPREWTRMSVLKVQEWLRKNGKTI